MINIHYSYFKRNKIGIHKPYGPYKLYKPYKLFSSFIQLLIIWRPWRVMMDSG